MAFDQSGLRWLGISDLIAEPEGPTFISYKVARSRLDRLRFVTQDPTGITWALAAQTARRLVMLNDDWTNWINTEREARDWKARFGILLQAAKKNIEGLSQIIEAGDRNPMRLAAGESS